MAPRSRRVRGGRAPTRPFVFLAGVLLLLASCTSEPELPDLPDVTIDLPTGPTGTTADAPSDGPAPTVPTDLGGLGGRLAVVDEAGNLITVSPDGSGEVVLAEVEPGLSEVRQPSWSPDGRSLAWAHVQVTDTQTLSAVVATAAADGTDPTEAPTAVVPFYLSWDPTSSRIAYLGSPGQEQIELSPDGKTLYVSDGNRGLLGEPYHRVRRVLLP